MLRQFLRAALLSFAAVAGFVGLTRSAHAQAIYRTNSGELISQRTANDHGLTRVWVTRVNVDRALGRVANITQQGRTLFVQTTLGGVQAIDAETGFSHWTVFVGKAEYETEAAGANDEYVGVTNGGNLYVLDRATGRLVAERRLGNAAKAPGCSAWGTNGCLFPIMVPARSGSLCVQGLAQCAGRFSAAALGSTDVAPVFGKDDVLHGQFHAFRRRPSTNSAKKACTPAFS